MARSKVFLKCPRCRSRLDLKQNIGRVGLCHLCGWAGSLKSEQHDLWVQIKVSLALVLVGAALSWAAIKMGDSLPQNSPSPASYETAASQYLKPSKNSIN